MPRGENQQVKYRKGTCFLCAKACGLCSWSYDYEPIEGWDASPYYDRSDRLWSYDIKYCPEYAPDWQRRKSTDEMDTNGAVLLIEAIARCAREDYLLSGAQGRKAIEHFFISDYGKALLGLSNPEGAVRMLRKLAQKRDKMKANKKLIK